MPFSIWAYLVAALVVRCSPSSPTRAPKKGHIVVAFTVDWEGAYLSPEGLDAFDAVRKTLGEVPITHFVSAGYFTKDTPDPTIVETLTAAIRKTDELAVHLHAWRSLAKASGVTPKLAPSFLTGTD